jgi:hypothetical protein
MLLYMNTLCDLEALLYTLKKFTSPIQLATTTTMEPLNGPFNFIFFILFFRKRMSE